MTTTHSVVLGTLNPDFDDDDITGREMCEMLIQDIEKNIQLAEIVARYFGHHRAQGDDGEKE